jgi:hypothetical protein
LLYQLWILLRIGWSALGVVYIFGKMLKITKTTSSKHILALIMMFINAIIVLHFDSYSVEARQNVSYLLASLYIYFTVGVTIYVWIFLRSADRIDSFLDKKGLKDKDEDDVKPKKNKKTKKTKKQKCKLSKKKRKINLKV